MENAVEAGADILVVQACASDSTIQNTIETARRHHKRVMVDFIGMWEEVIERAKEIDRLKSDYISLHSEGSVNLSAHLRGC